MHNLNIFYQIANVRFLRGENLEEITRELAEAFAAVVEENSDPKPNIENELRRLLEIFND